jgi:hypothetical protein
MAQPTANLRLSPQDGAWFTNEKAGDVIMHSASKTQQLLFGNNNASNATLSLGSNYANVMGHFNSGTVSTSVVHTSQHGILMTLYDPEYSGAMTLIEPMGTGGSTVLEHALSNAAFSASNLAFKLCTVADGSNTFTAPSTFSSSLAVDGTLTTRNLVYMYSNVIVYNSEEVRSNLVVDNNGTFSNVLRVCNKEGTTTTVSLDVTGTIQASGDVVASSDATLKTDLQPIGDALNKVRQLTGYTFKRIEEDDGPRHMGLVAQEVQAVAPELVQVGAHGTLVLAYGNVSALLVQAVKELSDKVDALTAAAAP